MESFVGFIGEIQRIGYAGTASGAAVAAFAYQPETDAVASAFLVAPTARRKRQMDHTIQRLKDSGIWPKARWLRFHGLDLDASLTNWKVPSEKATAVGAPLFTADQHLAGNTGLNYVNLGMNANALSQNDLGAFIWFQTGHMVGVGVGTGTVYGAVNSTLHGISMVPNNSGQINLRLAGLNALSAGSSDGFGLIGGSRFDSSSITPMYNGIARAPIANTSSALPALPIYLGGLNNNGSISNGITTTQSFLYLGQALTELEARELTAIVGEWLEAIRYGDYYFEMPGIGTETISAECIAYGLTGQSVMFALQAARAGRTVAIVGGWRDRFAFGMAGGGLGFTDFDEPAQLGGLPRYAITRTNAIAGTADTGAGFTHFTFQPKHFNRVMRELLNPALNGGHNIPVYLSGGVSVVNKTGTAIQSIETEDGRTVLGDQFFDGSYEGDLTRFAGVDFYKGREAAGSGQEAIGGVEAITSAAQVVDGIGNPISLDPWVTPGVPASGLVSGVHAVYSTFTPALHNYPTPGSADEKIPAYNFRLTFTNSSQQRIALPSTPPPNFNIADYELLLRWLAACTAAGNPATMNSIFKLDQLRNSSRYDINQVGTAAFTTNLPFENHGYPLGTYEEREVIWKKTWNHILGLWYVLQHHADARVPATLRTDALTYGLTNDHYYSPHENDEANHMPQLYIRESVRLISDVVMNANHMNQTDGQVPTLGDKTVSVASYDMDSHSMWRIAHETAAGVWTIRNEGGMLNSAGGANNYTPLPFGIFVPKATQCTNLSVSFGASLTHVAYGSSRMEFTAMQTGQSMGHAAALAVAGDNVIQNVDYAALRTALLASASLTGEVAPVLPQVT